MLLEINTHSLVNQKMRKKIQIAQNKCIHFCLKSNSREHVGAKEFKEIDLQSQRKE